MDETQSLNKCMRAAFNWLCYKAFDGQVPEAFQNLFVLQELSLQPVPHLSMELTNCALYSKACNILFNEIQSQESWQSHSDILANLSRRGIQCRDLNGMEVLGDDLTQDQPFNTESHIALIECIMMLHCCNLAPPTNVMSTLRSLQCMDTYGSYTSTDALEKWMVQISRKLFYDIVPKSGTRGAHLMTLSKEEQSDFLNSLSVSAQALLVLHHYSPSVITISEVEDLLLDRYVSNHDPIKSISSSRSSSMSSSLNDKSVTLMDLLLTDRLTQFFQQSFVHRVVFVEREDLALPFHEQTLQHIQQHIMLLVAELFHHLVGNAMKRVNRLLSQSLRISTHGVSTNIINEDGTVSNSSGFRLIPGPPSSEPDGSTAKVEKNGFFLISDHSNDAKPSPEATAKVKPSIPKDRFSLVDAPVKDDQKSSSSVSLPAPCHDTKLSPLLTNVVDVHPSHSIHVNSSNHHILSDIDINTHQSHNNNNNNNNHLNSFANSPKRPTTNDAQDVAMSDTSALSSKVSLKSQFQQRKKELQDQKRLFQQPESTPSPSKTSWLKQKTEEENRKKDSQRDATQSPRSRPTEEVSQLSEIKIRLAQKKQLIAKNKADQMQREVELNQQRKKQAFLQSLGKLQSPTVEEKENENAASPTAVTASEAEASLPFPTNGEQSNSFSLHPNSSPSSSTLRLSSLMRTKKETSTETIPSKSLQDQTNMNTASSREEGSVEKLCAPEVSSVPSLPLPTNPILAVRGNQIQEYSFSLDRLNNSLSDLQHEISQLTIQQQLIHQNMWEKIRSGHQTPCVGTAESSGDLSSSGGSGSNRATWGERSILVDIAPSEEEPVKLIEQQLRQKNPDSYFDFNVNRDTFLLSTSHASKSSPQLRGSMISSGSSSSSGLTRVSPRPTTLAMSKTISSSAVDDQTNTYRDPDLSMQSSSLSTQLSVSSGTPTTPLIQMRNRNISDRYQRPASTMGHFQSLNRNRTISHTDRSQELYEQSDDSSSGKQRTFFVTFDDNPSPLQNPPRNAFESRRPVPPGKLALPAQCEPENRQHFYNSLKRNISISRKDSGLTAGKAVNSRHSLDTASFEVTAENETSPEPCEPKPLVPALDMIVIEDQDSQEIERRRQKMLEQRAKRAADREKIRQRLDNERAERQAQLRMEEQLKEEKRLAERAKRELILQAYLEKKGHEDEPPVSRPLHSTNTSAYNTLRTAPGNPSQFTSPANPPASNVLQRPNSLRNSKRPKSMHSLAGSGPSTPQKTPSATSRNKGTSRQNLLPHNGATVNNPPMGGEDDFPDQKIEICETGSNVPRGGEYSGPKLFVPPKAKSNRSVIQNAICHCCLAGAVNAPLKDLILKELAAFNGSHFMVLFRDTRCQYRALYSFDHETEELHLICGTGPRRITHEMVDKFFKYNSGAKQFSLIASTNHLSTVVDGVTIKAQFWKASTTASGDYSASSSTLGNRSSRR